LRILFDHNVDRRFRRSLSGHEIRTTREKRWEKLENGALISAAAADGFEAILTVDKKLEHEQNLRTLPIPIIVLNSPSNALAALLPFSTHVLELLRSPLDPLLYFIQPDGVILRLTTPRQ